MKNVIFRRNDFFLVLAILLLCALLALPLVMKGEAREAVVRYRGEVLDTVPLSLNGERVYTLPEGEVRVSFSEEGVAVLSSSCPNRDCIRMGRVLHEGGGVYCLPLAFSVTLTGESTFDGITG